MERLASIPEVGFEAANEAQRAGDLLGAIRAYVRLLVDLPDIASEATFNLSLARRRYRIMRRDAPASAVICLGNVALAPRIETLAALHTAAASTSVIGLVGADSATPIETAMAGMDIPLHLFELGAPETLPRRLLDLVLDHPCDALHLCDANLTTLTIAMLYSAIWDSRLILDSHDQPLPATLADLIAPLAQDAPFRQWLAGADEGRASIILRDIFDDHSVASPALEAEHGAILLTDGSSSVDTAPLRLARPLPAIGILLAPDARAALFEQLGGWSRFVDPAAPIANGRDAVAERIIVYSVLTGDYEALKEPEAKDPRVRYLLFTDNLKLKSENWDIIHLDLPNLARRHASRLPKLLAHEYLPDHDISLYVDSTLTLHATDIAVLVDECLQGKDIAAYAHFERQCIYAEMEECIRLGKADATKVAPIRAQFEADGFPAQYGLLENAFLVRRNTPEIRALNVDWKQAFEAGAERDQFYLMYLLWKRNIPHAVIGNSTNFRTSPWVTFHQHQFRHTPVPVVRKPGDVIPLVIYSCLFGDYEEAKEPVAPPQEGVEYILFTDRTDLKSDRWQIKQVDESFGDLRRTSRLPKILAHSYLPPHEMSIYLDSSLVWECPDSVALATNYLKNSDIALYRHYARACVYDEIRHCMEKEIIDKQAGTELIDSLQAEGFPQAYGLFENAFIIRRNTPAMRQVNAMWWNRFISGPHRDQFYLMPSLVVSGIAPTEITEGPQFRKSTFMTHHKHAYRKKPGAMKVGWIMGGEAERGWAYSNNARRFINKMRYDSHKINKANPDNDVALFFDPLIHQGSDQRGRVNLVRLGGPRPLNRLFGGKVVERAAFLRSFDAIIALNAELAAIGEMSGARTYLVPNGIDLDQWPLNYKADLPEFIVGFAGNVHTAEERRLKGFDFIKGACEALGVKLKTLRKGEKSQISHEEMHEKFYGKISCLVHPVAEGKEGSSNVIMEALASGVPVITTLQAGFHAERLTHGENVLFARRNVGAIKEQLAKLRDDAGLRRKLSRNGRAFAERAHDINKISQEYRNIFTAALNGRDRLRVSFIPAQPAVENFATGRIRCLFMADALNRYFGGHIRADVGLQERADVIVVSQLCDGPMLTRIQRHVINGAKVIYDLCDPYFSRHEEVYGVHASARFKDLASLADLIVTPTKQLASMVAETGCETPIVTVADMIDYQSQYQPSIVTPTDSVVWFGNPGHGNFDSGLWALKELESRWKHKVSVISVPANIKAPKSFEVKQWTYDGFIAKIRQHGLALVSHDPGQAQKSNNRFLTAIANGVPVIATGSRSSADLLQEIGYPELFVSNSEELDRAMKLLADPAWRTAYICKAQAYVEDAFGPLQSARDFYYHALSKVLEKPEC